MVSSHYIAVFWSHVYICKPRNSSKTITINDLMRTVHDHSIDQCIVGVINYFAYPCVSQVNNYNYLELAERD